MENDSAMRVPQERRKRAQSMVEFALILPVLLFMIMGVIDFGRALFTYAQASSQLRSALRLASVVGYSSPTYLDCDQMRALASNVFFASANTVSIQYLVASSYSGGSFSTIYPAANSNNCVGSGGNTNNLTTAESGALQNGDILHIEDQVSVNMITPFFPPTLTFTLIGQRTVVTQVSLVNAPFAGATSLPATQTQDAADFFTQIAGGTATAAQDTAVANSAATNTQSAFLTLTSVLATSNDYATATMEYWGTLGVTPTFTLTPIYTATATPTRTTTPTPRLAQVINLRKWASGSRCTGSNSLRYPGLQWNRVTGVNDYYIYANGVLVGQTNNRNGLINLCGLSLAAKLTSRIGGCFNLNKTLWSPATAINYQVAAFRTSGGLVIGPLSNVFTMTC